MKAFILSALLVVCCIPPLQTHHLTAEEIDQILLDEDFRLPHCTSEETVHAVLNIFSCLSESQKRLFFQKLGVVAIPRSVFYKISE